MAPWSERAIAEAKQRLQRHRPSDQNLLSRAPPCFGRLFVPAALAVVCTYSSLKVDVRQATARKNNRRIFITCCTDLTLWDKGRKKKTLCIIRFHLQT
jgi:hypothetical protein